MNVEIDRNSGFCGGVIRAIGQAEASLKGGGRLVSIGEIVHNEEELRRLGAEGLETMQLKDLEQMPGPDGQDPGTTLLIRAHGEPPSTYELARSKGYRIIDCTCPVVLNIQKSIREAYARTHAASPCGQIVIFGKIGHAEVLGLVGQVGGDAVVVENLDQLKTALDEGKILPHRPVEIFSQTTKSPVEYGELCTWLAARMVYPRLLTVHDTICRQVASRHRELEVFARTHDVVLFVAGQSSSNGKVLFDLCKACNIRTYRIGGEQDIQGEWFRRDDNVGVCGATSTPRWLLDRVAESVKNLQ